jgi:accessory gene regulator protein AgrB
VVTQKEFKNGNCVTSQADAESVDAVGSVEEQPIRERLKRKAMTVLLLLLLLLLTGAIEVMQLLMLSSMFLILMLLWK